MGQLFSKKPTSWKERAKNMSVDQILDAHYGGRENRLAAEARLRYLASNAPLSHFAT